MLHESCASLFYKNCKAQEHKHKAGAEATAPEHGPTPRQGPTVLTGYCGCPLPAGSAVAPLCALGTLLSLLVPAQATRSPDCGGILTPSGLSYRKYTARTSPSRQRHPLVNLRRASAHFHHPLPTASNSGVWEEVDAWHQDSFQSVRPCA